MVEKRRTPELSVLNNIILQGPRPPRQRRAGTGRRVDTITRFVIYLHSCDQNICAKVKRDYTQSCAHPAWTRNADTSASGHDTRVTHAQGSIRRAQLQNQAGHGRIGGGWIGGGKFGSGRIDGGGDGGDDGGGDGGGDDHGGDTLRWRRRRRRRRRLRGRRM